MFPTAGSGALTGAAWASYVEDLQQLRCVGHEARGLFDRVPPVILLPQLALVRHDLAHTWDFEDLLDARLVLGTCHPRMLMKEVGPSCDLSSIQPATPGEMKSGLVELPLNDPIGSRFALLMFWMFEKGAHMGLPINSFGFCASRKRSALALWDRMRQSHALPSSSWHVKSIVTPGMMPKRVCVCGVPQLPIPWVPNRPLIRWRGALEWSLGDMTYRTLLTRKRPRALRCVFVSP